MLTDDLDQLYFSQLALSVYENCHLKFRRRYIDGLFWPADWSGNKEQKDVIEKGRYFHLMAQRYYDRGEEIPEDTAYDELTEWFSRLKRFRPYNNMDRFYPEHELRINKDGIKLVAKYDLIYIDQRNKQIIIYDWKTNKKRLKSDKLEATLQTRVYLFVLAEAGTAYFPENNLDFKDMNIIYWNPRYPAQNSKITYTPKMFAEDKKYIKEKIGEIKNLSYDNFKAISDKKICKFCEYRPICYGKEAEKLEIEEDDIDLELDWDMVDEI